MFHVPLPEWTFSTAGALIGLAIVGALVCAWAYWRRSMDVAAVSLVGLVVAALAAANADGSIRLQSVPIYSYGVAVVLALGASWWLSQRLARAAGWTSTPLTGCYLASVLSGLVLARALYVVTNLEQYASLSEALAVRHGGLVFYGALFGGLAGSYWYCGRDQRIPWPHWCDAAAPAVALGLMLGRFGCYFYGCDYGRPLAGGSHSVLIPLGSFPRWPGDTITGFMGAPAWVHHVETGQITATSVMSLPVHPVQLYEATLALTLFALLLWLRPRARFAGQAMAIFVVLYAAGRFVLEIWRDDPERGVLGPLFSKDTSVGLGLVAIALAARFGALSFASLAVKRAAGTLLVLAAIFGLWLTPQGISELRWSTSQWLAVASAIVVAALCWRQGRIRGRPQPI